MARRRTLVGCIYSFTLTLITKMKTILITLFSLFTLVSFGQAGAKFPVSLPEGVETYTGHEQRAYVNASQSNGSSTWIKYDARGFKNVIFTFSENISLFATFGIFGSNDNVNEEQVSCYPTSGNYAAVPTYNFIPGIAAHSVVVPVTHNYIILRCITFPGSSWNGIRVTAVATNTDIPINPRIPANSVWRYNTLPASAITGTTPVLVKDKVAGGSSTPYGMQFPVTRLSVTNTGGTGTHYALVNTASLSSPPTSGQIIFSGYIEAGATRTFDFQQNEWLYPGWNPIYAYIYASSGASVTFQIVGTTALSPLNN